MSLHNSVPAASFGETLLHFLDHLEFDVTPPSPDVEPPKVPSVECEVSSKAPSLDVQVLRARFAASLLTARIASCSPLIHLRLSFTVCSDTPRIVVRLSAPSGLSQQCVPLRSSSYLSHNHMPLFRHPCVAQGSGCSSTAEDKPRHTQESVAPQSRAEEPAAAACAAVEGSEAVTRAAAEGCNPEENEPQVTSARQFLVFCELAVFLMQTTSGHLASPEEIVSRLMELGLPSEVIQSFGGDVDSGLRTAASAGQLDVVKYLVEGKADVNARDKVKQPTASNRLLVWFGS